MEWKPIVRVQDREGRGPWRPGFSWQWTDSGRQSLPPPITTVMPNFRRAVMALHREGFHIGCAVRADRIDRWFTRAELAALQRLGFAIRDASKMRVVWENDDQVLVASRLPLALLPAPPSDIGHPAPAITSGDDASLAADDLDKRP